MFIARKTPKHFSVELEFSGYVTPMTRIEEFREAAIAAGNELWREASERTSEARSEFTRRTTEARDELTRRAALAREPKPEGVTPPPLKLLLGELGAVGPWRGRLEDYAASQPQPVMLLPGFGAHPSRMRRLKRALNDAGHSAHEWGMGFNLGPTPENFAFLLDRVNNLADQHGEPVALVGWSLGGMFARVIACRQPDVVRKVITLGTPFSGDMHANNAWRAYQFVTGYSVDEPPIEFDSKAKPPVPTVAIWSPKDGVIAPRSACGWPHERDRAVAVRCNHLAFGNDPGAIAEVLRQLDWGD
jgi:Alpha/beta hydrolase family